MKLRSFLDELRGLCERHGVALALTDDRVRYARGPRRVRIVGEIWPIPDGSGLPETRTWSDQEIAEGLSVAERFDEYAAWLKQINKPFGFPFPREDSSGPPSERHFVDLAGLPEEARLVAYLHAFADGVPVDDIIWPDRPRWTKGHANLGIAKVEAPNDPGHWGRPIPHPWSDEIA